MWLTRVVWGARSVPGKQWIGKYRWTVKMTTTRRRTLRENEKRIAEVTQVLSHPYLTQSEEMTLGLAREQRQQSIPPWVRVKKEKWMRKEDKVFTELQGGSITH